MPPVSRDICSRIFFPSTRDSCGYLSTATWTAVMAAHSYASKTAAEGTIFIILEQDRVNDCVCALRGFNGGAQCLFAAAVISIRKNNQCLAPGLLFHQFVRCQIDCVIQQCSAAAAAAIVVASMAARIALLVPVNCLRWFA